MNMKADISPPLQAAARRAMQFLRPPAEQPGQRAYHHMRVVSSIESAMRDAILAGHDTIALKLSALRSDAEAAFGGDVHAAEMVFLNAEIAECDRMLAEGMKSE